MTLSESRQLPLNERGAGMYDVRDLAQLLKCSDRHVRRMIDAGEIPGVRRFGRLVRASRAIVDKWLAEAIEQ